MSNIILICGGSCSGKTTLAVGLRRELAACGSTASLSMDDYYKDLADWPEELLCDYNFDHPDAIDSELLFAHLRDLMAGQPVRRQSYDFKNHTVTHMRKYVRAPDFLIVEGIFALYFATLRQLAAVRIFIHANSDTRLKKRVDRDIRSRGLTRNDVLLQYAKDVQPMHEQFIAPYEKYADLILDSGKKSSAVNLQIALDFIRERVILR